MPRTPPPPPSEPCTPDCTSHLILFHDTDLLKTSFPGEGKAVGGLVGAGLASQEDRVLLCVGKLWPGLSLPSSSTLFLSKTKSYHSEEWEICGSYRCMPRMKLC